MDYLQTIIGSLAALHQHETFWVLNPQFDVVYHNANHFNLEEFMIRQSPEGQTFAPLLPTLQTFANKAEQPTELIVSYKHELHLVRWVYFCNDQDVVIGHCLILLGQVSDFEYVNLVRLLLFNQTLPKVNLTKLSKREIEIAAFIARGMSYREIANTLSQSYHKSVTESTIGNTVRNSIYRKLRVYDLITLKSTLLTSGLFKETTKFYC